MEDKNDETSQKGATEVEDSPESKEDTGALAAEDKDESEVQGADDAKGLDFILDIPLEVSVELGRTQMLVNDLIQLARGSIIELSKLADEPMDIYVNRKLFARGEVVVVNEKFGIRLTDIISPAERVKSLS